MAWGTSTISAADGGRIQLWLGIFPVNWQQLADPALLEQQLAGLHRKQAGSFAALLTAMVLDPALQHSLNGPANHRRNPNGNLARELLELFSLPKPSSAAPPPSTGKASRPGSPSSPPELYRQVLQMARV